MKKIEINKKKTVTVCIGEIDMWGLDGISLDEASDFFKEKSKEFPNNATIDFSYGYGGLENLYVVQCREETDEEYERRVKAEAEEKERVKKEKQKEKEKEDRRKKWEELNKEFGRGYW